MAIDTCNLCLSEDPELTEEEKNEELAPIRYKYQDNLFTSV